MSRAVFALLLCLLSACESPPLPKCSPCLAASPTAAVECVNDEGGEDCPSEQTVPQQQTYSARGLYTYPNPLSEVPDGAFSRADDAVIRREGIIESRRGFAPTTATFGSSGHRLRSLSDFAGTLVGHTSANALVRYSGGSFSTYSGTYAPPTGHRMRFLQSAKSLYFTTSTGVKRLDEVTGSVFDAGVPQATGGTVTLASQGVAATRTITISGGSGVIGVTVGGTLVNTTWATSDNATATQIAANLNANATVAALVTASAATNVVTLTAVQWGTAGNVITTAVTGTGASIGGATLAGGVNGTGFLPEDSNVAYRYVWGIRNANDRVILGAPSGRVTITNPDNQTSASVAHVVQVPSWVTTSHFLQVYRSDVSALASVPASDDTYLVYEKYPTEADIAAGTLSFTDVTPDELKGAALYSSPNSGIPGSEKFQPPVCTDLAEYKERVWCSATIQRQRLLLTLLSVDATSGGMSNTDSLFFILGATTEVYAAGLSESGTVFKRYTDGTVSQNVARTAESLTRVINAQSAILSAFYVSGEYDSPGQVLIEARDLGSSSFFVRTNSVNPPTYWAPAMASRKTASSVVRSAGVTTVTVGTTADLVVGMVVRAISWNEAADEANFPPGPYVVASIPSGTTFTYADPLPNASSVGFMAYATLPEDLTSDPTDAPNGLAYAEYAEGADAVPLGNYLAVGSANYAIQRIIPLGGTLFIFKEEGTYILTGDTPETFSISAFPTPARIVAPESAVVLGNAIYALTDQGVMAFSENGAQLVSRPIEGTLAEFYAGSEALKNTTASVAFGVSYETEREYHLFLPSISSDTYATQSYVYNYLTRAWTRWTMPATCGYVLPSDGLEYLGNSATNTARVERKTRTSADYQDATGVAISTAVDWQVRTANDPGGYKHWQKAMVMLETVDAPTSVLLSVDTEISAAAASGSMSTDGLPYVSTYIPVDQSRSQTLTVGVSAGAVGKRLAVRGLAVDYFSSSTSLR